MDLTDADRNLILLGLFELTITHVENDGLREQAKELAVTLGGDAEAMFYGATLPERG